MDTLTTSLISALGMMLMAGAAVIYWRCKSGIQFRWFWAGAGLWTVAVVLKVLFALLINNDAMGLLKEGLSYSHYVLLGGLFLGVESSLFEIGLTLLAVLIWQQFGCNAKQAIGIGVGAGAFEAFLLGFESFAAVLVSMARLPGSEEARKGIEDAAATPLFWLIAPVERAIAILCHASSRALVLLGVTYRSAVMVFGGFAIFTLLDAIGGAAVISEKMDRFSTWWIELAILPMGLISIPILRWCYARWSQAGNHHTATGNTLPNVAKEPCDNSMPKITAFIPLGAYQ